MAHVVSVLPGKFKASDTAGMEPMCSSGYDSWLPGCQQVFCATLHFDCIVSRSVPQAITNMRKRVMGEPSRGVITMVNTDIEGYSGESRGF